MYKRSLFLIIALLPGVCNLKAQPGVHIQTETHSGGRITLTSTAFQKDSAIPKKFTCEGSNISPSLAWRGAPRNTVSFALVCEDPDAPKGMFVHWVIYNMPPNQHGLAENVPTT